VVDGRWLKGGVTFKSHDVLRLEAGGEMTVKTCQWLASPFQLVVSGGPAIKTGPSSQDETRGVGPKEQTVALADGSYTARAILVVLSSLFCLSCQLSTE
jgi:hypothetical protein